MATERTFTLIGKFEDGITPKLQKINKEIEALGKTFEKSFELSSKAAQKLSSSLEDTARATGKLSSTISRLGEDTKSVTGLSRAFGDVGEAAGRTGSAIEGIGRSAEGANLQAKGLLNTLLKAEGLSKFGDAMAMGFQRSMGAMVGTARRASGLFARAIKDAAEDEMADIKAASGMQGSFTMAGYAGSFSDAQRMYRAYDRQVSEMIRQSAAPTAKVVELQRYTLDTMGPLMLAAQGVAKGTKMKDVDPKKIQTAATEYGRFLEKVAILGQGTGSAGFRVAAGVEQLVTRGKIDTTIDFFTDNILLMKELEKAGFMGRRGGGGSGKMMNATDAQRMKAMMDAFAKAMSGEATAAMASSITGSLQGLQDTIFNPSVGILGMATTFGKDTQKAVNQQIIKIQNARIAKYQKELEDVQVGSAREKQLRISIEQAQKTRDQLVKEGEERITNPFQAFSYSFGNLVRSLTEALNAVGPVWESFAPAMIEFSDRVLGPLTETLRNVASDIRGKKVTQMEGFGRIVGEIFKTIGQIMGDVANMLTSPTGKMSQMQSEFMKGFMAAFKEPGSLEKAKKQLSDGISALISKLFSVLMQAITFKPIRPLVLLFFAAMFGPALIGAVIAGATPLIVTAIGRMVVGSLGGAAGAGGAAGGLGAFITPGGARSAARMRRGLKTLAEFTGEAAELGYSLAGRPGARALSRLGGVFGGIGRAGRAIGRVGRFVPGGALAFGAIDAGMRIAAGEDAGKAIGGAAASTIGSTLGGILGQALIPIPGVGAAVGAVAGGIIGDMIFGKLSSVYAQLFPTAEQAANRQVEAADKQLEAARKRLGDLGVKPPSVAALRGSQDPMKLNQVIKMLGLGGDKGVLDYQANSERFRMLSDQLNARGAELNALIAKYKGKGYGYSAEQIAALPSVKVLQSSFDQLKVKTDTAARQVSTSFDKLPERTSLAITQAMGTMRTDVIAYAIANKINMMPTFRIPSQSTTFDPANPFSIPPASPAGGTLSLLQGPTGWLTIPAPPSNSKNGQNRRYMGGLGDAISDEMRNKPSGSSLVIANSSETIIPAAGGLGMKDFMDTLRSGFDSVTDLFRKSDEKINLNQTENNRHFTAIDSKLEKLTSGAGLLGMGGPGNIIGVGKALLGMGLQVGMNPYFQYGAGFLPGGGGYIGRHAPGSYHYLGRALDVSGPPALLDAAYNRLRFTNPTELLWRVPGHFDHLHVAYALGAGMPAFFSSQQDAMDWERKATLGNVRVSSITSNSSEGFGGNVSVNAPITIHQQPGQSSEHLASLVAMELTNAIRQARSSSMYV